MDEPLRLVCPGCGEETEAWSIIKVMVASQMPLLACPACQRGFPMNQWRTPDDAPPAHVDAYTLASSL